MDVIHEIFSKYGDFIGYLVSALIVLAYIVVWVWKFMPDFIWKQLTKIKKKEQDAHYEASNYRKKIVPIIKKEMSELAEDVDVDRVILFEYSNGVSNLVGLPFLYATATNEVVKYDISQVSAQYQKMNVSLYADFIHELEERTYFYFEHIKDIKDSYPLIYANMVRNGVESGLFYSLYDEENTIGFIVVTTVGRSFKRDIVLPKTASTAQCISSMLNFTKLKERIK